MKSPVWRALALLSLTVLVMAMATDADAARRSSLAGNQFIDDADDMFAFPQLVSQYQDMLIIDMHENGENWGNASVLFGSESYTLNFNAGRHDYVAGTSFWAWGGSDIDLFTGGDPFDGTFGDMAWWDIAVGMDLGEMPFGFRIGVAADATEQTPVVAGTTTDTSLSLFNIQAGLGVNENIDVAVELGFGSFSDNNPPTGVNNDVGFTNIAFALRGDLDDVGGNDWRYVLAFVTAKASPDAAGAEDDKLTAFRGSFGPVFGEEGSWTAASYVTIDMMKEDDGFTEYTEFTLPGMNFAMEYYLNEWFVVRGGAHSTYMFISDKNTPPAPGVESETKTRSFDFMYTAGVGVDKGNWGLDMALEPDELHTGYVIGNGNDGDDTIALISAWLDW